MKKKKPTKPRQTDTFGFYLQGEFQRGANILKVNGDVQYIFISFRVPQVFLSFIIQGSDALILGV